MVCCCCDCCCCDCCCGVGGSERVGRVDVDELAVAGTVGELEREEDGVRKGESEVLPRCMQGRDTDETAAGCSDNSANKRNGEVVTADVTPTFSSPLASDEEEDTSETAITGGCCCSCCCCCFEAACCFCEDGDLCKDGDVEVD